MFFSSPIPSTYSGLFYRELGASDFVLSVIGFAGSVALALVQFPGGYLADKHGRRWLVFTMTFGVALFSIFFVFAPSWHFIVLGIMLQNFCLIYQPALFAIMLDSLSPENRGAGLTLQAVLTNIVGLPAPIIALFLISVFQFDLGMRVAYAIVTVCYFVAAALRYKLKETLPAEGNNGRPSLLDAFREYPKAVRESLQVWRKVPRSAFHLFVASAVVGCLFTGCNTYLLIFAKDVLGINASQWAFALAFASLTIAVPTILAGLRMDRIGRKHFLVLGYLCYVPAMLLFVFANFYLLLVAFFFWGLGQMLQNSGYQSLMGDLTPRELRGKVVGCSQFFIYLSEAFTQVLIGLVYAYVWRPLPFLMLAAGVVPVAIFVLVRVKEPSAKEV